MTQRASSQTLGRPASTSSLGRLYRSLTFYRDVVPSAMAGFMFKLMFQKPEPPADIETLLKFQTPTWGSESNKKELKATWLGHACFLVELPTPEGANRGARILFDPVFSHRCSPFSFMGPARFTRTFCLSPFSLFASPPHRPTRQDRGTPGRRCSRNFTFTL